jgi:hypothetical protein
MHPKHLKKQHALGKIDSRFRTNTCNIQNKLLGNSEKSVTLETSRLMKFVMQDFRGKELTKI